MRWTKPEQIENWGVRIAGWPTDLPFRNPSNNTVQVNTRLLELLKSGHIKFVKPGDPDWESSAVAQAKPPPKPAPPPPPPEAVMLPHGVVLHAGAMEHSDLVRHGAALFHALPPGVGVGVLNGEGMRPGMVALPVSVALPAMQGRIEVVASPDALPEQAPSWSHPITPRESPADNGAGSLKRKRDPADDDDDGGGAPHAPPRPRTPSAPATAAVSPLPTRASPT